MNPSRYNWLFEHNGSWILFNGFSGALAEIDDDNDIEIIRSVLFDQCDTSRIPQQLLDSLYYGGFLIDEDYDERYILSTWHNVRKYSDKLQGITVVITNDCNFRCNYCYQLGRIKPVSIREDVIKSLGEFIRSVRTDDFHLTLYGGEPLLEIDKCLEVLNTCKRALGNEGILYAAVVTNGYLLSEANARILADNSVSKAQVTIDGPRSIHNRKRKLADGSETYDQIIENVRIASKHMKVYVRCNVDKDTYQDAKKLDDYFRNEDIVVYYSPVEKEICNENELLEYASLKEALNINMDRLESELAARPGGCIATMMNGMVLSPNGDIKRCWNEVGTNREYGNIGKDIGPIIASVKEWIQWNPYEKHNRCYRCRMLPTCAGGCPYKAIKGDSSCKYENEEEYIRMLKTYYDNTRVDIERGALKEEKGAENEVSQAAEKSRSH